MTVHRIDIPLEHRIDHPPLPRPLSLKELRPWTVMRAGDEVGSTAFCVTPEDYQVMSLNEAETTRFIRDLADLIRYYRSLK